MESIVQTAVLSPNCRRDTVQFSCHGSTIEAFLYRPEKGVKTTKYPAVVTAPGFGGVKEMLIESYAVPLAEAGIVCLSLDYRSFGRSHAKISQDIDPIKQLEDIQAGLDYLEHHANVDRHRLGVWGTSMSGGHAISIAAIDDRIKCAVAIIPFLYAPRPDGSTRHIVSAVLKDLVKRKFGAQPKTIPIFSEAPGDFAVMTSDGGWEWMQGITENAPTYKNEITLRSLLKVSHYKPRKHARNIHIPMLVISATSDSITPAKPIENFETMLVAQSQYISYPGSHFELFGEHLNDTSNRTVEWFRKHL